MEVLHDKSSGQGLLQRSSDRHLDNDRALDWTAGDGDILLEPVSPLALADCLGTPGSCIELLAAGTPLPASSSTALVTLHTPDALRSRCKRILVDNALVKHRGQRCLYLVGGFLSWPGDDGRTGRQCAPVLLYRVILARRTSDTETRDVEPGREDAADGPALDYELRIASERPLFNHRLAAYCRAQWSLELPDTDTAGVSLTNYFDTLEQRVQSIEGVRVESVMALGTASAESHPVLPLRLPSIPPHFDASLAREIAGDKNLHELHAVLTLIGDYGRQKCDRSRDTYTGNTGALGRLRAYAARLVHRGVGHLEFQRLPTLAADIARWSQDVQNVLDGPLLCGLLKQPRISTRHLIRLAGAMELIDKAPLELDAYRHPDLCYATTATLLRRARHQARLIEEELLIMQQHFDLEKVPPKPKLLALVEELGVASGDDAELVGAGYFHARRAYTEFSREKPARLTEEHHQLLAQLAKLLRFRELFVNNTEYRLALGPGYRGLRTEWALLEQMSGFAQELSQVLESEALAARAIDRWDLFRQSFVAELDNLLQAADALRSLLRIAGTQWQRRAAVGLIERSQEIAAPVDELCTEFSDVQRHAVGTPDEVLARLSDSRGNDAYTELQAGETCQQIDARLQQGLLPPEALADTLEWLREASRTVAEHDLEIDVIIHQLQIA